MKRRSQAFPFCLPPTLDRLSQLSFAQDCLTLSDHHTAGQPFCLLSAQPCTHPGFLLFQDLLMVTYLANLTQSQIALNEKLVNL